jgi:hypothetical protein
LVMAASSLVYIMQYSMRNRNERLRQGKKENTEILSFAQNDDVGGGRF